MSRFNSFDDDNFAEEEENSPDEMDEFDQLRRRSVRTGSAFDELESEDEGRSTSSATAVSPTSSSFSMSNFSPGQRLILVLLVLLDILAITAGVLIFTGII